MSQEDVNRTQYYSHQRFIACFCFGSDREMVEDLMTLFCVNLNYWMNDTINSTLCVRRHLNPCVYTAFISTISFIVHSLLDSIVMQKKKYLEEGEKEEQVSRNIQNRHQPNVTKITHLNRYTLLLYPLCRTISSPVLFHWTPRMECFFQT